MRKENEKRKAEDETSIPKENERKEKSKDKRNDRNEDRRDSVIIESILNRISNQIDNNNLRTNNNSRNNNAPNSGLSRRDYTIPNADTRNAKLGGQQRMPSPCRNYSNTICYYGVNCRFDHPRICESWTEMGSCPGVNGSCKKPHPMICRSFSDRVECRR